jgi:predicted acyltransferase
MKDKDRNGGQRLLSLDALRGFDMLFIMGFSILLMKLCVAMGWGNDCFLSQQMRHVKWHGLAFMDTVFPLFLFIAGASFPFSLAKQRDNGMGDGAIALRCVKRGLLLFALGIMYGNFLKLDFAHFRIWSVLGRIGLAWLAAALIFMKTGVKVRVALTALILVGTALFSRFVLAPDAPVGCDPFSPVGNFGCWLDRTLTSGHIVRKTFDPEGFAGLVPAVATALFGMFAGEVLASVNRSGNRKALTLLGLGAACALLTVLFARFCPINKALWSPSFVLACGAYSFSMLSVFYWIVDVRGFRRWAYPFQVIGMNSITIYLAQRIIGFKGATDFFFGGLASKFSGAWGPVVWQAGYVLICWMFLWFLYRRRIFLKI